MAMKTSNIKRQSRNISHTSFHSHKCSNTTYTQCCTHTCLRCVVKVHTSFWIEEGGVEEKFVRVKGCLLPVSVHPRNTVGRKTRVCSSDHSWCSLQTVRAVAAVAVIVVKVTIKVVVIDTVVIVVVIWERGLKMTYRKCLHSHLYEAGESEGHSTNSVYCTSGQWA